MLAVACWLASSLAGCSRLVYRLAADKEVKYLVEQKSNDPRWQFHNFTIGMDPRARYFDPTDPDGPPMPYDDPAAHLYMHCVAGKKGYPCWHMNGDWYYLENPLWKQLLGRYNQVEKDGTVKLTMNGSVCLATLHSPTFRTQIETIYLSALDVSTERFRFDVQFFGDSTTAFSHVGPNGPPGAQGQAAAAHPETNTLTYGSATGDKTYLLSKEFSTGGELLVGFANSFVWQFAGNDTNVTSSLLNFSLVQPLLRNGGRVLILETLTRAERNLLSNLRAFQRFRQGWYAATTVGNSSVGGVQGPQRIGGFLGNTGLTGFTGTGAGGIGGVAAATFGIQNSGFGAGGTGGAGIGFVSGGAGSVGGFVGLLQQLQQVRNAEENLNALLRALGLLNANLDAGLIDIVQVDQFRQQIESARATVLSAKVTYELQLDAFKAGTIGLPPDVAIEPDDSMLDQFRFLDPRTTDVQHMLDDFVQAIGELPAEPTQADVQRGHELLAALWEKAAEQFRGATSDIKKLDDATRERKKTMSERQVTQFDADRKRLGDSLEDARLRFDQTQGTLVGLESGIKARENTGRMADELVALATQISGLVQELSLIKARARVETITIPTVDLPSDRALEIARANRLDWMNNRAQLVDSWRLIAYQAQQLKAGLDLTFSGDLGTIGNNPAAFNGNNGDLRVGLRFDAPFTRRQERNNYRSVMIQYQQTRRSLYQFQDSVNFNLRNLLRTLAQLQINMEIQRRAVVIAIRRVDKTREDLNRPPAAALPGQQPESLGPTVALNLITALNDLQAAQNTFMSVVLNHLENRMLLYRELGIMELDDCGMWIDRPINDSDWLSAQECPMPPPVPDEWLRDAGIDPGEAQQLGPAGQSVLPPDPATQAIPGTATAATNAGAPGGKPSAARDRQSASPQEADRHHALPATPQGKAAAHRETAPRKLSELILPDEDKFDPEHAGDAGRAAWKELRSAASAEPRQRADGESPSAAGPILRR